jgi:diadenosine tetraphosphate (Ap4A) HIT family hydrolase
MPKCPFCSRPADIIRNTFYERDGWFAFLDGNPITRGHTILAKRQLRAGTCPVDITRKHLKGHDQALVAVVDIINEHYRPKSILFASLRGSTKHMHTHVYPLWAKPESRWRRKKTSRQGTGGRLLEFLGWLEKRAYKRGIKQRKKAASGLDKEAGEMKKLASKE